MNEINNSDNKEQKVENPNPALFQVESFNKAVASRDKIISSHITTISALQQQIGNQQTTISDLMKKVKDTDDARISAETEVAQFKTLKKDTSTLGGYIPKSEEEIFAEKYQKAKEKLTR